MTTCFRFGPSADGTLWIEPVVLMKHSEKSLRFAGLRPRTLRAYRLALHGSFPQVRDSPKFENLNATSFGPTGR